MKTIKIDKSANWTNSNDAISSLNVKSMGFVKYVQCVNNSQRGTTDEKEQARRLFRLRIKAQVEAKNSEGNSVELTDAVIANMPVKYAILVKEALSGVFVKDLKEASVTIKGNGLDNPIMIRLGTPIQFTDGKQIEELEFKAETLGDIEDGLICDGQLDQTVFLLSIAKPFGPDINLLSLPSFALEQITLMDGVFIMQNVTDSFFEIPTSS